MIILIGGSLSGETTRLAADRNSEPHVKFLLTEGSVMSDELPIQFENVRFTDNQTLDPIISQIYGREFKTQRYGLWGEPCAQGTCIIFTLNLAKDPDELWSEEQIRMFQSWLGQGPVPDWANEAAEGMPYVGTVFYDLLHKGLLLEGKYVIHVWW